MTAGVFIGLRYYEYHRIVKQAPFWGVALLEVEASARGRSPISHRPLRTAHTIPATGVCNSWQGSWKVGRIAPGHASRGTSWRGVWTSGPTVPSGTSGSIGRSRKILKPMRLN